MAEQKFDYILARIQRRGQPETYIIRKYEFGKANILDEPIAHAVGRTLSGLADTVCSQNCLPWAKDRVIEYTGPEFSVDLSTVIYPLKVENGVADFLEGLPSD